LAREVVQKLLLSGEGLASTKHRLFQHLFSYDSETAVPEPSQLIEVVKSLLYIIIVVITQRIERLLLQKMRLSHGLGVSQGPGLYCTHVCHFGMLPRSVLAFTLGNPLLLVTDDR
jgi:hypothetical protein